MPAKIRLARHGKKRYPFYHIVVADSRAPRDGKIIERIGDYNPNTNPATINLEFDKALNWLKKGAQPTDTCRAILSYKGVMMKYHLLGGVNKGAFSEEEAERRFQIWLKDKENRIQAKVENLQKTKDDAEKARFEAEKAVNEARAQEIAKRRSELAAEAEAAAKAEAEAKAAEEAAAEDTKEEPKAEETEKSE